MGTNVYFLSRNKYAVLKYFGSSYKLTHHPYCAYQIHVLKRSAGWLPLWQAHDNCKSVADYKKAYDSGFFEIYDEYSEKYTWEKFYDQFAKFNGGVRGAQKLERIQQDKNSPFYDRNLPEYVPISHISGNKQSYKYDFAECYDEYFTDPDGYEFSWREFS